MWCEWRRYWPAFRPVSYQSLGHGLACDALALEPSVSGRIRTDQIWCAQPPATSTHAPRSAREGVAGYRNVLAVHTCAYIYISVLEYYV